MYNASENAFRLIKEFEGLHDGDLTQIGLQPKLCPAGYWTEGWGHLIIDPITKKPLEVKDKKRAYELRKIFDEESAEKVLHEDVKVVEKYLNKFLSFNNIELNQNQFDALVSFVFNLGVGAFEKSSIPKLLKEKRFGDVSNKLMEFVYSKGKKLQGLVFRREKEKKLFDKKIGE